MDSLRKTIIIVDDVSFFLYSTSERLKKFHDVFIAKSAEALFALLDKMTPDLILLDINMPDVSGFEIFEKLKEDTRYYNIPVIFVSSKDDRESIIQGLELGAADYITKPFEISELVNRINDLFNFEFSPDNKARILVVDDSPSILKSVNHILSGDYLVYVTPKPEHVRMMLKKIDPDLFILDCNMPVLTGFDLVPIIRSVSGHEETPILFLTAEGTKDNLFASITVGASDFLVKPIDELVLREKIWLYLENYLARRRVREIIKNS